MKKLFCMVLVLVITGCGDISNTPTRQVESFLNKYQTLDKKVIEDLDSTINNAGLFNTEDIEKYREIIKKQYKNLSYKIKEEKTDGSTAIVTAEITVIDFAKVLAATRNYKDNNMSEFQDERGNYNKEKYITYVLDKLDSEKEKVKYTLDITLIKTDGKWEIDNIGEDIKDKILGIYEK